MSLSQEYDINTKMVEKHPNCPLNCDDRKQEAINNIKHIVLNAILFSFFLTSFR